jgi:hypothetical protein
MLIVMPLWLYLLVLPAIFALRLAAWTLRLVIRACARITDRRRQR